MFLVLLCDRFLLYTIHFVYQKTGLGARYPLVEKGWVKFLLDNEY